MNTKYITNTTTVDLDTSREIWDNRRDGDASVTLWASIDEANIWAETSEGPVAEGLGLRELLESQGFESLVIDRILDGDLTDL